MVKNEGQCVNRGVGPFSGHLVQPSNLAHNECVFFASRDASRKVMGVKRPIAFLRLFQCLALRCL